MKRRDFIGVLGGVAASWTLAAGAQQAVVKVPRIGLIQVQPWRERHRIRAGIA
jgi:hypothetical protein